MSLLMEALRKAEEAKRRMQQEEQAAAGRGARDAAEIPAGDRARRIDSPFTLEEREPAASPEYNRDAYTAAQDEPPPAPEPQPQPEPQAQSEQPEQGDSAVANDGSGARNLARRQQRASAASVFAAKQNPARNRKTVTILVIVMLLMIPLGGGVLWYLQSAAPSSIAVNASLANYDVASRGFIGDSAPAPAAPPAAASSPENVAATASASDAQNPGVEQAVTAPEANIPADTDTAELADTPAVPTVAETGAAAAAPAQETAVAVPEPPPVPAAVTAGPANEQAASGLVLPADAPSSVLEVSRTRATTELNPGLVSAYARLQAGDLLVAGQLYQEVLATLPNNRDALLGLALVHMRQGQAVSSRELYARLLQLNPRDPLAHTGLLQTMQVTDPAEHEAALKKLIGDYPDVAQLTLALGNLYASQQRWSEAQAAYYNALLIASRSTNGPVHPDYAFNLAVSLEQLNEPRAALEYYRQAQTLAAQITPGFDPQLLNSRLAYLEQAQP